MTRLWGFKERALRISDSLVRQFVVTSSVQEHQ